MKKDKLTTQQLADVAIELLKLQGMFLNTTVNNLLSLADQNKDKINLKKMKDELVYLNIFMINQALFIRFKDKGLESTDYLHDKITEYVKQHTNKTNATIEKINILSVVTEYMKKHNELAKKFQDKPHGYAMQFTKYISERVVGKDIGHNIMYVAYFSVYYKERLEALLELIDKSIELK